MPDYISKLNVNNTLYHLRPGVLAEKTYTGLYGSANDAAGASFYFAKVIPANFTTTWQVKLRIDVTAPAAYTQSIDVLISGYGSTFSSYDAFGTRNASIGLYYINLYRATQAGITGNYGHLIGVGLRSSTNPTDSSYARTITVKLLETVNCGATLWDTALKYASVPGTGSTNYSGLTEANVSGNGQYATNNGNTVPSAYCSTAAGTAAKTATCSSYVLLAKSYLHVVLTAANTAKSALTLNVNSKGAKPIWINGAASSASNYTLPAGTYIVYYDGTNYYFRTDGKLTASITGDAATVNGLTVKTAVPANAVFTDSIPIVANMGTISSLPVTKTVSGVTSDMVCISSTLGTPSAQTGDWTVTTAANSVTVSGAINGSTTLTLILSSGKAVTGA